MANGLLTDNFTVSETHPNDNSVIRIQENKSYNMHEFLPSELPYRQHMF